MQLVTAALIEKEGLILLARRKKGKHMGAKWEFPGGKVDPGETPEQCLERELREEFSIRARVGEYLGAADYHEGDLHLDIRLYRTEHLAGEFQLHEHEEIRWVEPQRLLDFDLADSDRRLAGRLLDRF
ncbi:MAG: (deoxy)nucleoside triphosphate pyrophosphohydrolase [Spirochaetales bacterium]|nr:(deoxy)nucleoside triphosphate pyrophosphohydrolase [Spirochaetales bacterium]